MTDKLSGYIGLARRAGQLVCGAEAAYDCARRHKAAVLLLAADAAKNTVKQMENTAKYYHVRLCPLPLNKADFGAAAGFAQLSAAAVENHGLAKAIIRIIEAQPADGSPE